LRESGAKLLDFCHTAKLNSTIFHLISLVATSFLTTFGQ
jgi:hypothetical protein